MYYFPQPQGMLYLQFFDSCSWFSSLIFVGVLCRVVPDLNENYNQRIQKTNTIRDNTLITIENTQKAQNIVPSLKNRAAVIYSNKEDLKENTDK